MFTSTSTAAQTPISASMYLRYLGLLVLIIPIQPTPSYLTKCLVRNSSGLAQDEVAHLYHLARQHEPPSGHAASDDYVEQTGVLLRGNQQDVDKSGDHQQDSKCCKDCHHHGNSRWDGGQSVRRTIDVSRVLADIAAAPLLFFMPYGF